MGIPATEPGRSAATRRRSSVATLPTLGDVARAAGVSTATASRALSNPEKVRPDARQAVASAVERLGYVRHGPARALASRRTHLIGAIVPTLDNPIFARCLEALETQLQAAGFTLILATSGYDPVREQASIRTLLERGVAGLMLVGSGRPVEVYDVLAAQRVACCLTWSLGEAASGQSCVGFDNAKASRAIVEHLWDLGHRRYAMVAGLTEDNDRAAQRLAGVRDAVAQRGGNLLVQERPYTAAQGRQAALELLRWAEPPTALICGNDILAFGAMSGCAALGLRVPHDVSVTGFDDLDLAACSSPPLTTVRVDAGRIGRLVGERLIALVAGRGAAEVVEIPAALVVRESTAPPNTRAPEAARGRPRQTRLRDEFRK